MIKIESESEQTVLQILNENYRPNNQTELL